MSINNLPQLAPGELEPAVDLVTVYHKKTGEEMKLQLSAIAASPSGVSGAIQFSNGSAFASDATNFFWNNTTKRLGIGTNAPTAILQAQNATNGVLLARFKDAFASTSYIDIKNDATLNEYTGIYWGSTYRILAKDANPMFINCATTVNFADGFSTRMAVTSSEVQIGSISGARLGIKGSGSTSATTSLLVQNSAGTAALTLKDDLSGIFTGIIDFQNNVNLRGANFTQSNLNMRFIVPGATKTFLINADYGDTNAPSAILEVQSTTKGFLPPRMTTTQKNAIATPAAGLVVYDSTTNKLCCYNGSTWNDLF